MNWKSNWNLTEEVLDIPGIFQQGIVDPVLCETVKFLPGFYHLTQNKLKRLILKTFGVISLE